MKSVLGIKDCYGCGVCAVSCTKRAISMALNTDGFYEPRVNAGLCVDCGICVDVCAFRGEKVDLNNNKSISFFEGWSKDNVVRESCSSGGVAFEIARYLIKNDYTAILCRYNSKKRGTEHYLAQTEDELMDSIGSKYIQSDLCSGLSSLQRGGKYLIVGTPCQIDSVSRMLKKRKMEHDVILMDFFCHGVPSMLMWEKYLSEVEKRIGSVAKIVWRDKKSGWHDSWVMKVDEHYASKFSNGDLFYKMFLKNRCLAKPCYESCKYKGLCSAADIRIGDLWGSKYANNEEGVNGVVGMTEKGVDLLKKMNGVLYLEKSSEAIVCESQMKKCAHRPRSYNYVMRTLHSDKTLCEIDIVAGLMELMDEIPSTLRYYVSRLPVKLKSLFRKSYTG